MLKFLFNWIDLINYINLQIILLSDDIKWGKEELMFLLLPMDKNEQNFDDIFASFLFIEYSKTGKGKI